MSQRHLTDELFLLKYEEIMSPPTQSKIASYANMLAFLTNHDFTDSQISFMCGHQPDRLAYILCSHLQLTPGQIDILLDKGSWMVAHTVLTCCKTATSDHLNKIMDKEHVYGDMVAYLVSTHPACTESIKVKCNLKFGTA